MSGGIWERLRMLRVLLLVLLAIFTTPVVHAAPTELIDPASSVYKIRVKRDGYVADGSAVLVAPGRLLTACHVTRSAQSIEVGLGTTQWQASSWITDIKHDLCVLDV